MPLLTLFSFVRYTNITTISFSLIPICEKNRRDMQRYTKVNVRIIVYTSNTGYFLKRFSLGRASLRNCMILWVLEAVLVADVRCIRIRLRLVLGKPKDQCFVIRVRSRKDSEAVSDAHSESAQGQSSSICRWRWWWHIWYSLMQLREYKFQSFRKCYLWNPPPQLFVSWSSSDLYLYKSPPIIVQMQLI